jgi:hypothetical protein
VGTYEFDLIREDAAWKISRLKFLVKFVEGNRQLENAS